MDREVEFDGRASLRLADVFTFVAAVIDGDALSADDVLPLAVDRMVAQRSCIMVMLTQWIPFVLPLSRSRLIRRSNCTLWSG